MVVDKTVYHHRDAHGHAPHGWRLNEETLRWEPVMLSGGGLAGVAGEPLEVSQVLEERDRLKRQLLELQAKARDATTAVCVLGGIICVCSSEG